VLCGSFLSPLVVTGFVSMSYPEVYDTEEGLKRLATYLRSVNGVKVRHGIEHDKRVEYFKGIFLDKRTQVVLFTNLIGKRLIDCLLEGQQWPKKLPKIEDKGAALALAVTLLQKGFFHRSEKNEEKKGHLVVSLPNFQNLNCIISL
jgi:hypothetical protein